MEEEGSDIGGQVWRTGKEYGVPVWEEWEVGLETACDQIAEDLDWS